MTGWRLLLTRPAEESAALAAELAAAGIYSSSLPLLAISPLTMTDAQRALIAGLDRYCAVIVVSKPAARLGLELVSQYWPHAPRQKWFSVGAATAQILADYGLDVSYPQRGDDSEALLAMPELKSAVGGDQPSVLILRGEGGRELLADRLRSIGAQVDYLEVYRRVLPSYPPATLSRRVEVERLNALVVSSGQGFEHLRQMAGDSWPMLGCLPLFVPSPRVAELARSAGAQHVVDCRGASATALLAALREHPAPAF
ncbi:uroporphyrinogen-III synthase [Pseudomonas fragi]|uniref:uroporphyrinogen-III synthase n=1 Tax=Pseudomonas TaxID=286 RepID=UPI000BA1C5F9|nr:MULTISPECIES: uroporphyrinogen-III synthase [Pseudomonas]MDY7572131.1 uroporphyrinogen-III synthase [Pseudomonas sp. CCC4.1]MEB0143570.1 uroporphyrinogen-III synthase [Pseudomonas sp. CCC4.1]PAA45828.1 uroporphyrinogen-III synthase [Pseudomonas fragi]